MIDINFHNPLDQIRVAVGDPASEFVSDNTILSAYTSSNNNIDVAALKVASLLKNSFTTLADREREGGVEVYYTKLYERYSKLVDDLKKKIGYKAPTAGIIIGGVSLTQQNEVWADVDKFTMYHQADWYDIMLAENRLYNNVIDKPLRSF